MTVYAQINYAQTNLQLYQQLARADYPQTDILAIHRAYEIAIQQFSGQYRSSGKTFIAHLMGVSSILVWLEQPVQIIIAGMIHSIYQHGDFGAVIQPMNYAISQRKRESVAQLFGAYIEELAYRYTHLDPNAKTFQDYFDRHDSLSPIAQELLLIRLADLLEDTLDDGLLFCPNWQARQRHIQDIATIAVDLAHQLGYSNFAIALEESFRKILETKPVPMMQNSMTDNASFLLVPSYYRKTLPAILKEKSTHWARSLMVIYKKVSWRLNQVLSCSL